MTGSFFFDGHPSEDLGIYIVSINGAEDTIPLFGGQSYVSQDVIGHDFETFIKTKKENIKFTLYFSLYESDGKNGSTDSIEYMHCVWQKGQYPEFCELKVI